MVFRLSPRRASPPPPPLVSNLSRGVVDATPGGVSTLPFPSSSSPPRLPASAVVGALLAPRFKALAPRGVSKLPSFTVGAPNSPDATAARAMAEHLGTEHREHAFDAEEALEVIDDVIYHMETCVRAPGSQPPPDDRNERTKVRTNERTNEDCLSAARATLALMPC